MKVGDTVKLVNPVPCEWMEFYSDRTFLVEDLFEEGCRVRMLGDTKVERHWFVKKDSFEVIYGDGE
jgi:hypothetical protein|tara:strand:- start:3401 stop:3598 length:198 start_codon:yes stop_codon:yes gene_type:complete